MAKADRMLSMPPTNTSAIDHPMMFPPRDPTRRRFLAVAAVASAVGSGSLAAAAAMAPDVPKAVTVPIEADPIHDVIEAHRKAAREHTEAIDLECACEEAGGIYGERREEYTRLYAATDVAWLAKAEAGCALVNTPPTTLAGILALCRYIEPLFAETDETYDRMEHASGDLVNTKPATLTGIVALCRYVGALLEEYDPPDLPEYISYDDDTQETPAEALCHTISAAIEELMKAVQT